MSNLMGKIVDRAQIIRSSFSDLETAVIKATKHNTKVPKEKHVRRLVVYTHDEPHKIPELVHLLIKRLEFPDWLVVMKTLATFHRLLRDGSAQVINELRYKSSVFNLRKFADMTSPEAHHQSLFIRKYSQYIEEKVLVFKLLGIEFEKEYENTKNYTVDELFERIPRLQSQMNALLNCRAAKEHLNNSIIIYGFGLMLKDSFKLYKALNDGIINMLEHYFNMSKSNAVKALEIYKLFSKETDGLIQFFDITRKFSKSDLPEIQHAPTTLVDALENYIKELDEGKNPNPNNKGHTVEKLVGDKKKMDKLIFDDKQGGFDMDEDYAEKQATKMGAQMQARANAPTKTPSQTNFDPFADDFGLPTSQANKTTSQSSYSNFNTAPTNQPTFTPAPSNNQNQLFDPFGFSEPAPANKIAYDDKKKQIEFMFNSGPSSTPLTPTPAPLSPTPTPQPTGYGQTTSNYNAFATNQPTFQPANNAFYPAFGSTNNPTFNPTSNQFNTGFNTTPSFQPTNTAPSFQPTSNNPFAQPNNNNPFG